MKSSKTIIATLVLSLIFLGGSGIAAQAAGSGTQQKKQVRQENTVQNRTMKRTGTATQAGTLQRTQKRQEVKKRTGQQVD